MSTHTPGPWQLVTLRSGVPLSRPRVVDFDGGTICTLEDDLRAPDGQLIAAAPDLLAACEAVLAAADAPMASGKRDGFTRPTEREWREIVMKSRAAIAAAKGTR